LERRHDQRQELLPSGTVEAPNQQEAYRIAIEKFEIPVERQNRLFVGKLDNKKDD
jgi:hypothetical protein